MTDEPLIARWQVSVGMLPIDWTAIGEEVMTHLFDSLRETSGVSGHSGRRWEIVGGGELHEIAPRGLETRLVMVIAVDKRSVHFSILGNDEAPSEATLEPWSRAFRVLDDRLGR